MLGVMRDREVRKSRQAECLPHQMKTAALDGMLLVLLAAVLIWPLFQVEYFDNWMSIDGGFIGDARFLREHLPSPGWAPFFYCGNRFDYLYPPAMRYGAALISRYGSVYALMRSISRSRVFAASAALASLVLSPVLLIFKPIRHDSALHMPQHLNV